LAVLAAIASASVLLTACGDGRSTAADHATNASASLPTLVVGYQEAGMRALAEKIDAFKDAPYEVKWASFETGPPEIAAMSAGEVDVGDMGAVPAILGASENLSFKLVASEPMAKKYEVLDYIVAQGDSSITAVADLKGKSIGVPFGTAAHGYLLNAV
jgi:sulfonate transport system substrate-binding protein